MSADLERIDQAPRTSIGEVQHSYIILGGATQMFYQILLYAHNYLRWIVLALALWALIRAYRGWLGGVPWTEVDRRSGLFFSIAYDIQLLNGLVLTFISPIVRSALSDFRFAMGVREFRSILVEHIPLMIVGVVLVHVTSSVVKKATEDVVKHKRAAIGYSVALLVTLLVVPWWRPLLRGIL
jgi:hypothetical protein